ncbi:MAG: peptide chain release factor 1 [Candidatus Nitrohelix vancouverensis]|uniref:Peptide chain release factor 1 n=1 Tax=Candidatus Nitrohelix vancouverensis TaxID=2705534 RepID=A0A7T0C1L9_9BACT|nr:MAG: peptide chain release factor 1 [Candidatus Nitrohelix vancouverensis]
MFDNLVEVEKRYDKLNGLMSDPQVIARQTDFQKYAREQSELAPIVAEYRAFKSIEEQIKQNEALLETEKDPELVEMAEEEAEGLQQERDEVETRLKRLLLPKDPRDEKGVILEIRAGTGGEEASLFASDLFRMYMRYAETKRWKTETLSQNITGKGGYKEVIVNIQGRGVFSKLKYESGTHRVQRVPETETQGRIHTSAVTVAILPEVGDVDVSINPNELKIDVFRSSGPGGQSVNTTDSAVRITHIPTGLVVSCQDEKSQHKNKEKGMRVLRARLYDERHRQQQEELARERKEQVGSGDRSGRIRTYNYPQERVTDHRIGLTLHKLSQIMEGDMDEISEKLTLHFQAEALNKGVV